MNPTIVKDDSAFRVLADESKALILSLYNTEPTPSTWLYECDVFIATDAPPGTYPVMCGSTLGATSNGTATSVACVDGSVTVTDMPICGGDENGDRIVTINELVNAVINSLEGCPE